MLACIGREYGSEKKEHAFFLKVFNSAIMLIGKSIQQSAIK